MSEETPEATEAQPDKSDNNANLRKELEQARAEAAELREFKINETVRDVGLDPKKGNGAALKRLLGDDASEERARELIAEFGWDSEPAPEKHEPNPNERAAQEFANRGRQLDSVATADEPQDIDSRIADLNASLQQARAAQKWDEAKAIGNQLMQLSIAKMRASVASHV